jgi:hypothetical protein
MSNVEIFEFSLWAKNIFPGFTTDPVLYAAAQAEWEVEKQIRALEEEGMTRSDAQAAVECM